MVNSDNSYHPCDLEPHTLQFFNATPVPMFLAKPDGRLENINTSFINYLGFQLNEINLPDFLLFHEDELYLDSRLLKPLKLGIDTTLTTNKKYTHSSGATLLASLTIVPQVNDGEIIRYLCQVVATSEEKNFQQKLQLASLVFEKSSEGMMVTDKNGNILDVNASFTRITGYTGDEVYGKNASILSSGQQDDLFYKLMWKSINKTGQWKGEIWNRRKDNSVFPVLISINTDYDESGNVNKRVALFSDQTDIKAREKKIFKQAYYDSITGLANRELFIEHLNLIIKLKSSKKNSVALLLVDIHGFKEINDTLGHEAGDEVLRLVAQRLQLCVTGDDFVARLGGNEFSLILHDISRLESLIQSILNRVEEPLQLEAEDVHLTAKIGISIFPDDSSTVSGLLKSAGLALCSVKKYMDKSYSYFTQSMKLEAKKRLTSIKELREAIDQQQFILYFQPIVNLNTQQIFKAEALIRWNHPQRGLVGPDQFIPIAEESGHIVDIGRWVVNDALQQVYVWRETYGIDFQLSINESPLQFISCENSLQEWFSYLTKLGLPGEAVSIEITENLLLDFNETVDEKMQQFKDANIQISLDDFGTGYASLSYLKRFQFTYLKIDKSYVQSMQDDNHVFILCESIIQMAHKLGIKVIAEGIETHQQLDILKSLNCDFGQGYLFSCPLPADEFELLLSKQNNGWLKEAQNN